jgi:peptide/nickel transport system permease protein
MRFIVRRLLIAIPLLVAASFLCFALTTAMGDPLGDWKLQRPRTEAEVAAAYQRIGYDKPVLERYVDWADGFVVGDWKTTVTPGNGTVDVREEVTRAFWVTARLVVGAEIVALLLGMMVGVVGAVRQYSWFDYAATGVAFALFAMPLFCLAVLLKFGGIELNDWLESLGFGRWIVTAGPPVGGFTGGFFERVYSYSGAYILPTLCLVAIQFALYSRFQRASMLDTLNADYVRTARAKGLNSRLVIAFHALPNALLPVITLSGVLLGFVLAGSIPVERAFGTPGLGNAMFIAVSERDVFVMQNLVFLYAVVFVLLNILVDIIIAWLDPRIRLR